MHPNTVTSQLEEEGFARARSGVARFELERVDKLIASVPAGAWSRRGGLPFAVRNLHLVARDFSGFLRRSGLLELARQVLGPEATAVSAYIFDKLGDANWSVPCHQDVSFPVRERFSAPGFSAWSSHRGVPFVQPPFDVLNRLVALRLHLDPCPAESGALQFFPRSHRSRLSVDGLGTLPELGFRICEANPGDIFWMKPLLAHRSGPSSVGDHRRVLHLVFDSMVPTGPHKWCIPTRT